MLTTFMTLVMPILLLLMAAVTNLSGVVHAKLMLQNAADRAAYAGAAVQAAVMTDMGAKNREVHDIFKKLESDVVPNSSNGARDVAQKVQDAKQRINTAYAEMEDWNSSAHSRAKAASHAAVQAHYAVASLEVHAPHPMLTLLDNLEGNQRQHLRSDYNTMVGGQIWEPASHDQVENVVQSYYVKDSGREVRWQVELTAPTPRGVMSNRFVKPTLHAVSAAQPHGSSIKDCGLNPSCPNYEVSHVPYHD